MRRTAETTTLALLAALILAAAPGCKKKDDAIEDLPELPARTMYSNALQLIEQHKLNAAVKLLQQIDLRYAPEDRDDLEPLIKIRTADATFYQDTYLDYIDARTLYLDFANLFTDHPLAPYAQFQAGMCSLQQASNPSKDQTQTLRAIQDFREVTRRYPNSRFAQAAEGKIREAEAILAEHEYRVGAFYMDRKSWDAAVGRFNELLDRYPDYLELDKVYVALAESLLKLGKEAEAGIYLDKLLQDYPDSSHRDRARELAGRHDLTLEVASAGAAS